MSFLSEHPRFLCIHRESDADGCGEIVRTKYLCDCIRHALELQGRRYTRRWYKYTKACHADGMTKKGGIKVGTLLEYRNAEKYRGGTLDELEGTRTTTYAARNETWTEDSLPDFFRESGLISICGSGSGTVSGEFAYVVQARDHYTFCVSTKYDEGLLPEFEADAIVEIFAPAQFVAALQASMTPFGRFVDAINCEYHGRVQPHGSNTATPLSIKDAHYAHQAEVRVAWVPNEPDPIRFVILQNPAIRDYCRRIL